MARSSKQRSRKQIYKASIAREQQRRTRKWRKQRDHVCDFRKTDVLILGTPMFRCAECGRTELA